MTTPDLTYLHRRDHNNNPSVAPFINNKNVWDIPPEHWVPDIEEALLNAYQIGREQAFKEIIEIVNRNQRSYPSPTWTKR